MSMVKTFTNGIIKEPPVLVYALGLCPSLAVTSSAINGLGMGVAATFVLVMSNIIISMIKKAVPDDIRIPIYVMVIATFVTVTNLVMKAYTPALSNALGIFIPLIVVNCIILGRAEAFAGKNGVIPSFLDGLGMGIGFTLVLIIIVSIREFLGAGSIFGMDIYAHAKAYKPALVMILAPGGFLTIGFLIGLVNYLKEKPAAENAPAEKENN